MVVPWYDGQFYRGTPILVNLDSSSNVNENFRKSGSRINNHLFTYSPYKVDTLARHQPTVLADK